MKYTVQIVGVGGQGVLMASMVLGNAAMAAGHDVSMSEVHGMAQRGGTVLSTLRFGDGTISPLEPRGGADLIIGFEPVETCRAVDLGNEETTFLMNLGPIYPSMVAAGFEEYPLTEELVGSIRKVSGKVLTIEAGVLAIEAGRAVTANAVMIGAAAAIDGFPLPAELLKKTLLETVPEKSKELNNKAFDLGYATMAGRK